MSIELLLISTVPRYAAKNVLSSAYGKGLTQALSAISTVPPPSGALLVVAGIRWLSFAISSFLSIGARKTEPPTTFRVGVRPLVSKAR